MSGRPWYVLRVIPQREIIAEKQVRQLGYEAMAPYEGGLRKVRGNNRSWKWPLYPGYLFASWHGWWEGWNRVAGNDGNEADMITAIWGYLHPVWTPMPYLLSTPDVKHLQSIADGKYKRDEHEAPPRLKVGDRVIIPDGPFEGRSGVLMEISGKKATVSVKGEKSVWGVDIDLASIEKM